MTSGTAREIPTWVKLDNAANIYPPTRTRGWAAMFRMSATLAEPIDPETLDKALSLAIARVPCFSYRLRKGFFWYFFEKIEGAPPIQEDVGNPLMRMDLRENNRFLFRVRWYKNRIAVEYFHALTDGTGGMSFLLTLAAEYLHLRHGIDIPAQGLVLSCRDKPLPEESEDSFQRYARKISGDRREPAAYRLRGTPDRMDFLNITTGILSKEAVHKKAKEYGVSVTALFVAILVDCCQRFQFEDERGRALNRPVKVQIPVNLRRFYGAKTMRNFASYINVGVNSAYGRHSFQEILAAVKHTMGLEITEKALNSRFSANVNAERNPLVRAMPLFIKAPFLRASYLLQGDRYNTTTLSNLGEVKLPEEMRPYISRLEFLLGVPAQNAVVCACATYEDTVCLNFSRKTLEPRLERAFFTALIRMGVPVKVESNRR